MSTSGQCIRFNLDCGVKDKNLFASNRPQDMIVRVSNIGECDFVIRFFDVSAQALVIPAVVVTTSGVRGTPFTTLFKVFNVGLITVTCQGMTGNNCMGILEILKIRNSKCPA